MCTLPAYSDCCAVRQETALRPRTFSYGRYDDLETVSVCVSYDISAEHVTKYRAFILFDKLARLSHRRST